tara:strand:+ start:1067 stop:1303 length:237 start_codon:yes stop_codon:yes gene_type:complete
MKKGDLVRIYTIANTHVERGAYGIIIRKSLYDADWWVVYVMSENKLYTFHTGQLQPLGKEPDPSIVDIHKSYYFFDED